MHEINRKLEPHFPRKGPKALNGPIMEHFQDIPDAGVSLRIAEISIEIIQTQDKSVRIARLYRPKPASADAD